MIRNKYFMTRSLLAVLAFSGVASASSITLNTAPGATAGGQAISASATVNITGGTVSITLSDTLANPTDAGQLLSDFDFVLSSGQTVATLSSSSGLERMVAGNGTYTDGSTVATGWGIDNLGGGIRLHVLGTPIGPAHTVIGGPDGSNVYSNANGSIAGNGAHNPFLVGPVTFTLAVAGVTADTTVTGGYFSFGTTEGNNVPFTPRTSESPTPEPLSSALVGTGLISVFFLRRKVSQTGKI